MTIMRLGAQRRQDLRGGGLVYESEGAVLLEARTSQRATLVVSSAEREN